ncbi:hypothetical protein K458DRAFT_316445 [Lentithecium fluviatile CBS 122367]|uniref:Aminoglycoside phosphotransferase domain-containing protein n=1 Tax=Lentithecium fluviatile CBS 122367 TaxID=1168545 RepID=A0A6G1IK65_9PLEO|nr:hypothetical protein K458DRAFT_316445 [Lentithecium fluviatile CBS 122367]
MGCDNYHLRIEFPSSSEKWLVRVPRPGLLNLGEATVEYMYASEFATLKFLEGTSVPAPRAFAFDVASNKDNKVGSTYLIMEFLEGEVFDVQGASGEAKKRIYEGVAEILVELSRHPFPKACSLVLGDVRGEGESDVMAGKIAGLRSKVVPPFGPFDTAGEYYMAIVDAHLDLIAEGRLYPELGVEAYLAYAILRDRILDSFGESAGSMAPAKNTERFYLTHIDPKGDHILASPSGHISGIIDWESARITPFSEAFGPSLFTADLHTLYSGNSGITPDDHLLAEALIEAGAPALADAMRSDERARRLHFGLGSAKTEGEMWDLIRGLLDAFGVYEGELFTKWRGGALQMYRGDARLDALLR